MPRNPNNPRSKEVTIDEMRDLVDRLRTVAAAVKAISHTMEEREIKTLNVLGVPMIERGFDSFGKFVSNCEKELRDF